MNSKYANLKIKHWYWLLITLYFYITDVQFFFFPLSSRKIIGLIGICYLIYNRLRVRSEIIGWTLLMYVCLLLECIFSGLFTGFRDISFEVLLVVRIIILFGIYFIYKLWPQLTLKSFLIYFIYIVLLNDIIALIAFLSPPVAHIITTLEPAGEYVAERYEGLRFVGPGSFRYFEGGVVNCLALIATFYLYSIKVFSLKRTVLIIGLLLCLGSFIARTSIIGLVGFIFLISRKKDTKKRIFKLIGFSLVSLPILFFILDYVFKDNAAVKFAFEMVYNVIDGKGLKTESSNSLSYQYIFPTHLKSWLIGDGIWMENNAYYMHTDVGFSRLIFLWGILGCLTFILFLIKIVKISTQLSSSNDKLFGYLNLIILILLNAKGFSDINYFFIPSMLLIHRNNDKVLWRKMNLKY